ncbi:MAG: hypothetical protein IT286_01565 [Proteobacteria bacterium]|jgi:hypothetical protein|nr:hypothetical protein [Pseudomonadota bacterium]
MRRIRYAMSVVLISSISLAWAHQKPKKDLYIEKLGVCDSIGLEKRFFPKGTVPTHPYTDSLIIKYGCVGTDPDTYYFLKYTDTDNNEAKFNSELKTFSDLVNYYKNESTYTQTTFLSASNEEVKVEKHRFDKKQ